MCGKHHCTGGQGGLVYTCNQELYRLARCFADRGKSDPDAPGSAGNFRAGLNCNLNELSAAIGVVQLQKLPSIITRRRRIAESIGAGLRDSKTVSLGWTVPESEPVYWFLHLP